MIMTLNFLTEIKCSTQHQLKLLSLTPKIPFLCVLSYIHFLLLSLNSHAVSHS